MSFPALNLQLLDVVQGKARDFDVTLSSSAGALSISDVAAVWFTVKERETDADGDAIFQKELGAGITLTGTSGDNVLALIQVTNADTALLTVGRTYFFDLQVDTVLRGAEQAAAGRIACRQPITTANA